MTDCFNFTMLLERFRGLGVYDLDFSAETTGKAWWYDSCVIPEYVPTTGMLDRWIKRQGERGE